MGAKGARASEVSNYYLVPMPLLISRAIRKVPSRHASRPQSGAAGLELSYVSDKIGEAARRCSAPIAAVRCGMLLGHNDFRGDLNVSHVKNRSHVSSGRPRLQRRLADPAAVIAGLPADTRPLPSVAAYDQLLRLPDRQRPEDAATVKKGTGS
ncbi:hypothetical protein GCM10025780_05580 [Frondihabitans cladoniiphilus]|uniref:Uncharacterized protein n=1 Tax=Frondihabitans cladoniiphilus TaxID=715785 RepID=A0ABP8VM24_9MICO